MSLKFPTLSSIIYPVRETIVDSVRIASYANRAEQRQSLYSQPYRRFPIRCQPVKTDLLRLWEFYQLCRGPYKSFEFKNPDDLWAPLENVAAYWPLHEAEGTKVNDLHGFINPAYSCRFAEESLTYEQMTFLLVTTGIELVQDLPIVFTNNYGTLSGGATWIECPDGSAGVNFDGTDAQASMGNIAALNVGTGDFSFAIGVYPNALANDKPIVSKKADNLAGTDGWSLLLNADGSMDVYFSDGTTLKNIASAAGALVAETWKVVMVTMDRDGNGQIYVNNVASGAAVDISAASLDADNTTAAYIARQGAAYGNIRARNFLFDKKVWTQADRDRIWNAWRGTFQI